MVSVKFISETSKFAGKGEGFPHSAFFVNERWFGFKPRSKGAPLGTGFVDHTDLSNSILRQVTFLLPDDKQTEITGALASLESSYEGSKYVVCIRDCVTFSADFAEAIGLRIPPRPNLSPDNFVIAMGRLNGVESKGAAVK